jgi:hypothetical protein
MSTLEMCIASFYLCLDSGAFCANSTDTSAYDSVLWKVTIPSFRKNTRAIIIALKREFAPANPHGQAEQKPL